MRDLLTNALIEQSCRDAGHAWRDCLLNPVATVLSMVAGALWPEESWQAGADLLWNNFCSQHPEIQRTPPTSGALSKARAKLPPQAWDLIFQRLNERAFRCAPDVDVWRGHRVLIVDGATFTAEDTPELHRTFGASTGSGSRGRYPLVRGVALSGLRSSIVVHYALGAYADAESTLLDSMLGQLRPDDLILADRHYASAHRYARLQQAGLHFVVRKHQTRKIERLKVVRRYGPNDLVVEMPVAAAHRRHDPTLPATVTVRAIRCTINTRNGREQLWLITSLLDAQAHPAKAIVALYAKRWRIETTLLRLKVNLSADRLRSRSPEGVRKEIASRMLTLNLVNALRLEAAARHDANVTRIGFAGAVRAILAFAPALATVAPKRARLTYDRLLQRIAENQVIPRYNRQEPRMLRHEPKHYPMLKTTRQIWRKAHQCA